VTISLAMFRGFPMRKVGRYILAQILGACFGAFLIYANYHHSIERVEGGAQRTVYGPDATASLFFTFPQPYLPWTASFYSEFLASGVLLCAVFALSDSRNVSVHVAAMHSVAHPCPSHSWRRRLVSCRSRCGCCSSASEHRSALTLGEQVACASRPQLLIHSLCTDTPWCAECAVCSPLI
jgi:hypothetical protein